MNLTAERARDSRRMHDLMDLHPYQHLAIKHILDVPRCALWIEMGLGKSVVTLKAIEALLDSADVERVLVVAPLRVARSTWPAEIAKWGLRIRHRVITGTAAQRRAAAEADAELHLVNYENLTWLVEQYGRSWPWDMVVLDEVSKMKNRASLRWKALAKVQGQISRLVELTGTPAPNGLIDLWAPICLLDRGERLGRSLTRFRERWFDADYFGYKYTPKPGADAEIHAAVADLVLTLRAEDYLALPDYVPVLVPVTLPGPAHDLYTRLEKDMFVALAEGEVTAVSAAALSNKCRQVANGHLYTDGGNGAWEPVHDAKLQALADLIGEIQGAPLLVAYSYQSDLARLRAAFPQARVLDENPKTIDQWNAGQIPLLLAHPACLSGDTEVLTENRGWLRLTEVAKTDRVFDGIEFVTHGGCSYSGYKETLEVFGIEMTPEHRLLISGKWERACDVRSTRSSRREACYTYQGDDPGIGQMFSLRGYSQDLVAELPKAQQTKESVLQGVRKGDFSPPDSVQDISNLARNARKMRRPTNERVQALWRARDHGMRALAKVRKLLRGHARWVFGDLDYRANRCEWRVLERQLSLGYECGAASKQAEQSDFDIQRLCFSYGRTVPPYQGQQDEDVGPAFSWDDPRRGCLERASFNLRDRQDRDKRAHVYDLINCGPRSRFLIRNKNGDVFVSHNSAGHGLNLQAGGHLICWFGLDWSLELYQQFCARLHRQGQTRPVFVYHLIAADTVDELVLERLRSKRDVQDILLDALKVKLPTTEVQP